jgi:hypothetical protein
LFDTLLPTNCAKYGAVEEEFMHAALWKLFSISSC